MIEAKDPPVAKTERLTFTRPRLLEAGRRISLLVYFPHGVEATLLGAEPVLVGRGAPSRVRGDHPSLSRQHARFELDGDEVWLEDLGSTNGTRVNGEPITKRTRVGGEDEILLGSVRASIHGLSAPGAPIRGLLGHEAFRSMLAWEVERHRTFRRKLGVMLVRALPGESRHVSGWLERVQRRLRSVDLVAMYSEHAVELALPELAGEALEALAHDLVTGSRPALVCGVAQYPEAGATAEELMEIAAAAAQDATLEQPVLVADTGRARPARGRGEVVVASPVMHDLLRTVERLARAAIPVLVVGETGTGKEVIARALHERGPRKGRPMRCVNCAAIPEQLLESLLFGHEKGAFTGATRRTDGVFREANGGTVFLDEIGELSAGAQAALLRVLEMRTVTRVGGSEETEVDARLVAATHRDLAVMCEQGSFRRDLLFRINSIILRVPPLRERLEEIEPLAQFFLEEANRINDAQVQGLERAALRALRAHDWPGNVRELRNAIHRAVVLCREELISPADLTEDLAGLASAPPAMPAASTDPEFPALGDEDLDFKTRVARYEEWLIRSALDACDGNRNAAARQLRIPRRTLTNKLRALGIND